MLQEIKVDSGNLGCYKEPMARTPKEKRSELVGVMVTPAVKEYLETVGIKDERSASTVGWLFMLRGIEAYLETGRLHVKEPLILPNATEVDAPKSENNHSGVKSA